MIHPAGLGGRPSTGQRSTATSKRFLDSFLGKIDIAEVADQHRDGGAVLFAEDPLDVGRASLHAGQSF
jgi:hypothetical protein